MYLTFTPLNEFGHLSTDKSFKVLSDEHLQPFITCGTICSTSSSRLPPPVSSRMLRCRSRTVSMLSPAAGGVPGATGAGAGELSSRKGKAFH